MWSSMNLVEVGALVLVCEHDRYLQKKNLLSEMHWTPDNVLTFSGGPECENTKSKSQASGKSSEFLLPAP